MSTTVRYGYNPNRAGELLLAWCIKARKALCAMEVKPAAPISEASADAWEAYFGALKRIDAMDDRALRAELKVRGLTVTA